MYAQLIHTRISKIHILLPDTYVWGGPLSKNGPCDVRATLSESGCISQIKPYNIRLQGCQGKLTSYIPSISDMYCHGPDNLNKNLWLGNFVDREGV